MFRSDTIRGQRLCAHAAAVASAALLLGACARESAAAPTPVAARPSSVLRAGSSPPTDEAHRVHPNGDVHRVHGAPVSRATGDDAAPHPAPDMTPASPARPGAALSDKLTRPAPARLTALGDLHGDLEAARRALRLTGAIDENDHWIGGKLVLVQTGDVLDRGDDDRGIVDLLARLRLEASAAGGEVLALSGNHEMMNVQQNFYYVTPGGFEAFKPEGGREAAFRPGASYARKLAEQPIFVKVGDSVFVHGGILPKHVDYGLDRMNDELQRWMRGELFALPEVMLVADGPLWTRLYSLDSDADACDTLDKALVRLDAKRMVVGHTPQLNGITSACDGHVWRIDVGMSRYYGGPVQALEIQGNSVRVLRESQP